MMTPFYPPQHVEDGSYFGMSRERECEQGPVPPQFGDVAHHDDEHASAPTPVGVLGVGAGEPARRAVLGPHVQFSRHRNVVDPGLQPDRPYWYRFTALGAQSGPGRGRTLPAPGAKLGRLRFIAAGCQNYEDGLYTAYRAIAGLTFRPSGELVAVLRSL